MQTFKQANEAAEEEDGWLDRIDEAPIYTPTAQEWEDPLDYIRSEPRAAALGVASCCMTNVVTCCCRVLRTVPSRRRQTACCLCSVS